MTKPATPRTPSKPPISFEREKQLREALTKSADGTRRLRTYSKGEIIVQEGDDLNGTPALLVLSGRISESMTRATTQGLQTMQVSDVTPRAIANTQALDTQLAMQPARLTVRAEEDTEVVLLDLEALKSEGPMGVVLGRVLKQHFGQTIEVLFAQRTREMMQPSSELLACQAQLENERAIARDARQRMEVAVKALESERERMNIFALGAELYMDRVREYLLQIGLDESRVEFTPDEASLLVGDLPENIAALRAKMRSARPIDIDVEDFRIEIVMPTSTPDSAAVPPPRPRMDTVGYGEAPPISPYYKKPQA